jgi:hypothetical protein
MMNVREKSDSVIVAVKSPNKAGHRKDAPVAETMEPRAEAKENARQQSMRRAQNRESVKQALGRVRQAARQRKTELFTTLFHHLTIDLLRLSFLALKRDAAAGVDGVKWRDYESTLRAISRTCMPGYTGEPIGRSHPDAGSYPRLMDGNARSLWPHSRTRSSRERRPPY